MAPPKSALRTAAEQSANETLVLIRNHPHVYSDISALHYRPWKFYNGLIGAGVDGVGLLHAD